MCLVLSTCSEALITTGFATFLPKFIENQFGLSSSSAATLAGKTFSFVVTLIILFYHIRCLLNFMWVKFWMLLLLSCFSRVWLCATLWTVGLQTPLSREFSRQEDWSGLPCLLQRIFPAQGLNPGLLHCRQILYHWATGEAQNFG